MTRQVDVKALISHIVKGDGADRCRICMGDTTEGQVYLEDTVMVDGEKPVTLAELLETITGVEVEMTPLLPNTICNTCASHVTDVIAFIKLCKTSHEKWNQVGDVIKECKVTNKAKSVYVVIGKEEIEILTVPKKTEDGHGKLSQALNNFKQKVYRQEAYKKRVVRSKELKCPDCEKPFVGINNFNLHIKNINKKMCAICKKVVNLNHFKEHLKRTHRISTYPCGLCSETYTRKSALLKHLKEHNSERSHTCFECNQSFRSSAHLSIHIAKHKRAVCAGCGKRFFSRTCLKYHKKNCSVSMKTTSKFICDHCTKEYNRKSALRVHMILHLVDWKHKCKYCDKIFPNIWRLNEHDNIHNRIEDRYVCSICEKKFSTRRGYERHNKRHHLNNGAKSIQRTTKRSQKSTKDFRS